MGIFGWQRIRWQCDEQIDGLCIRYVRPDDGLQTICVEEEKKWKENITIVMFKGMDRNDGNECGSRVNSKIYFAIAST